MIIDGATWAWLLPAVAIAAVLYSSVGHGGASGYLAVMALVGMEPTMMKPAALTMNVFVASLVLARLARAGYFNWRLFWPFALGSVPLAYVGGMHVLSSALYQYLVGVALLIAAVPLIRERCDPEPDATPSALVAMPAGAGLGFVSGITGVGGGIFLSPLLLLLRWTNMRTNAAIAAAFILVNSVAGLAGHVHAGAAWPAEITWLVGVAVLGAVLGSEMAVRRLAPPTLRRLLGAVLIVAGTKMILTA